MVITYNILFYFKYLQYFFSYIIFAQKFNLNFIKMKNTFHVNNNKKKIL